MQSTVQGTGNDDPPAHCVIIIARDRGLERERHNFRSKFSHDNHDVNKNQLVCKICSRL